jgi:hypothetical protein
MSLREEIEKLKETLADMESRQAQNWLGKWAKSLKLKEIKDKIQELETRYKKNKNGE